MTTPAASLPDTVSQYAKSRAFTETTTPPNFLKHHATRPGVWGRLVVASGALSFDWAEGDAPTVNLKEGETVVIPPEVAHRVQITGPVEFVVEFYR